MRFVYPYETEPDGASITVEFPDVPGAVTQVDPGEGFDETVRDCLVAALGGYVAKRLAPPPPSPAKGRCAVSLGVMVSAKIALAMALSEFGLSNVGFAKRLGVTEKVVRRLLDLDHPSRIDRLEVALNALGQRVELSVRPIRESHSLAETRG